jgi:hypothetical protein
MRGSAFVFFIDENISSILLLLLLWCASQWIPLLREMPNRRAHKDKFWWKLCFWYIVIRMTSGGIIIILLIIVAARRLIRHVGVVLTVTEKRGMERKG